MDFLTSPFSKHLTSNCGLVFSEGSRSRVEHDVDRFGDAEAKVLERECDVLGNFLQLGTSENRNELLAVLRPNLNTPVHLDEVHSGSISQKRNMPFSANLLTYQPTPLPRPKNTDSIGQTLKRSVTNSGDELIDPGVHSLP